MGDPPGAAHHPEPRNTPLFSRLTDAGQARRRRRRTAAFTSPTGDASLAAGVVVVVRAPRLELSGRCRDPAKRESAGPTPAAALYRDRSLGSGL